MELENGKDQALLCEDDHENNHTEAVRRTPTGTSCGWGKCKPSLLQRCGNLPVYTVFMGLFSMSYGAMFAYYQSQLTTIQKVYGFNTAMSGWLISGIEPAFLISVMFVGYYGHSAHRPRWLGGAALLLSACSLVLAMPYFIFWIPEGIKDLSSNSSGKDNVSVMSDLCVLDPIGDNAICPTDTGSSDSSGINYVAFAIFIITVLISGFGPTTVWTLGVTYIDDNAEQKAPTYLALMFSTRTLAPVIGYLLGAYTASIHVDLKDTGSTPEDTDWIGCWWLGFVICGIAIFISSIPLTLFPKTMLKKGLSKEDTYAIQHLKELRRKKESSLKNMGKAIVRLLKNSVYMFTTLGGLFDSISLYGFVAFVPKYLEVQFHTTTQTANLITGLSMALTVSIFLAVSGVLTTYVRCTLRTKAIASTVLTIIVAILFACLTLLKCDQTTIDGIQLKQFAVKPEITNLTKSCNENCQCNTAFFHPTCVDDVTYYSPCFAGCSESTDSNSKVYNNCSCRQNGTVEPGICDSRCNQLTPYVIILVLICMAAALPAMPWTMISLRCVHPDDKSIAMGFASFAGSLAFLPTPVIYGMVIDQTCAIQRPELSCGRDISGCLVYDKDAYNLRFHMIVVGLRALVPLCQIVALIKLKHVRLYADEYDEQDRPRSNSYVSADKLDQEDVQYISNL
ncbi:solute carrier organic anion transporter family member 74D-like [Tubulanus polymorphus]|uniref:solute carrier organic anion transporter family member 74D-like n=1 Tax=Tubulanus polymorphus TaxID=672921 RepID=UPI003DA38029